MLLLLRKREVIEHGLNRDSVHSTTINEANVSQTNPLISPEPPVTVCDPSDEQVTHADHVSMPHVREKRKNKC
jgi:hypothetical protein